MSWVKAVEVRVRRWVWRMLGVLSAFGARVARRAAGGIEVVLRRAAAPAPAGLAITLSGLVAAG